MAVVNPVAYIHTKATINITSPALDLSCPARSLALTPSDSSVDISTQCSPGATALGITTWTFSCELLNSYDAVDEDGTGLWNQLEPLAKTLVQVAVKPADAATDSTNPTATFSGYFPSIPFINVQSIGDKTLVPITMVVTSGPVFTTA